MVIKGSFPRFQENYTLTIRGKDPNSQKTVGIMYVGKYFTAKGEFDEPTFILDVQKHIKRYKNKNYITYNYDHSTKSD